MPRPCRKYEKVVARNAAATEVLYYTIAALRAAAAEVVSIKRLLGA